VSTAGGIFVVALLVVSAGLCVVLFVVDRRRERAAQAAAMARFEARVKSRRERYVVHQGGKR
jgi:hypothetical protein